MNQPQSTTADPQTQQAAAEADATGGARPTADDPKACRCGHAEPERDPKWCPRCGREWRASKGSKAANLAEDLVDGVGGWFSDALARRDRGARRTVALCVVFGGLAAVLGLLGTAAAVVVAAFV